MPITGLYPAGFWVLVYLLEMDSPLVALMPFWPPPYLLENPSRQPVLICTRCHTKNNPAEFMSSVLTRWRYTLLRLNTVKIHSLDINSRPLVNNTRFFASAWRPSKLSLTPFFLVWEALFTPHTLWITLKSSVLIHKIPTRPSSYMLFCASWKQTDNY